MTSKFQEEHLNFAQLGREAIKGGNGKDGGQKEELKMAPMYSSAARTAACSPPPQRPSHDLQQYGLLGWHRKVPSAGYVPDGLSENIPEPYQLDPMPMILNTDTPWSAFICGSQGSGKSHTLACMLENCLMKGVEHGKLEKPLAGIVFHYDPGSPSVCEAAKLCSKDIRVKVLVSPIAINAMTKMYKSIPGSDNLDVVPLKLLPKHLSAGRMKNLMAFDNDEKMPLYMATVSRKLQEIGEMADKNCTKGFNYTAFREDVVDEFEHSPGQKNMLLQRFQNLDFFLKGGKANVFDHQPGTLTVVDLTSDWIDAREACQLFDICLQIFMERNLDSPGCPMSRVIALDEAHKYLKESTSALSFTENLLTKIRLQRHEGTRIIIATQEPTLAPEFLEHCSMTFVHRFSSPNWFKKLQEYVGGLSPHIVSREGQDGSNTDGKVKDLLEEIMELGVGEALFCGPAAMVGVKDGVPMKLAMNFMRWKTRGRLTTDGGKSVEASGSSGLKKLSGSGSGDVL